jgi:hypothetical protein
VTEVVATARIAEVARMLGGAQVTDATLLHATEMIATQAVNTLDNGKLAPVLSILDAKSTKNKALA